MRSKHRAGPETTNAGADPPDFRGRLIPVEEYERTDSIGHCRGSGDSMQTKVDRTQHGKPYTVIEAYDQPATREGQAGPYGVAGSP